MNNDNKMPPKVLTNAQLELLKMFSSDVAPEDWEAIRDFAKKYFAKTATSEMDKFFKENGWNENKIEEWAGEHIRLGNKREELLVKAQKLDKEIEQWEMENNITAEDYERWSKEHFRTPYKPEK